MDRLIALLAALVGLIALGGALLVQNNADATQQRLAAEIAALRSDLAAQPVLSPRPEAAPSRAADEGSADTIAALERRLAALEQTAGEQAAALDSARAAAAAPVAEMPLETAALPSAASAVTSDGPTTDCIPIGTRFMAQSGDSFPICKTRAVVDVTAVSDGQAVIAGPGALVVGSTADLGTPGCTIAILSADIAGFAEMRVSCF